MKTLVPGLTVAVMVLLHPASGFAQETGVKAGVNFASLTPEEDDSPDLTDDNGDEDRIKNRVISMTFGFRLR